MAGGRGERRECSRVSSEPRRERAPRTVCGCLPRPRTAPAAPEAAAWRPRPRQAPPLGMAAALSAPRGPSISWPGPAGPVQHKQALPLPHSARAAARALSFRLPPLPRPRARAAPRSHRLPAWEAGPRKRARSWRPARFPLGGNTAFFTFNPEKYGSQKACF